MIHIALTIAALKGLDERVDAFVQAPVPEKAWTVQGLNFGNDALYGLKSAGATFRSHFTSCMYELGYEFLFLCYGIIGYTHLCLKFWKVSTLVVQSENPHVT